MNKIRLVVSVTGVILLTISVFGQTTKKPVRKNPRPTPSVAATPTETPTPEPTRSSAKKNERPETRNQAKKADDALVFNYRYEFSAPNFVVTKIVIEHDENGNGRFTIMKRDWSDPDSDPMKVSPATMERIKAIFTALNFLDSSENYQYEKDYQHLGNHTFRLERDGKKREVTFNWTENADAKALMDEYRKLGNQANWIFDMNVARVNQPLDAPKLVDVVESYFKRNELSDPVQLIPYLKEISLDERIPLIARNHATRIIGQIEKERGKGEK